MRQKPMARTGGVRNARAEGTSVFLSPDPELGPAVSSQLLDNPNKIASLVAEHAAGSIATRILGPEQTINPGISWFTQLSPEDMQVDGIAARKEGSEYPMVRITPGDLQPLQSDDIGGKFRVSDEARDAGVTTIINDGIGLIVQGIRDRLDDMVIAALEQAAASTSHGLQTVTTSWQDVQLAGATPTNPNDTPLAHLVGAQTTIRLNGLMNRGDMLVINPVDEAALKIVYGSQYAEMLAGLGIEIVLSNRVPVNAAYLVGTAGLGGIVSRNGLTSETWRDPAIRSTWIQCYLEPAVYISRPANVVHLLGIFTPATD